MINSINIMGVNIAVKLDENIEERGSFDDDLLVIKLNPKYKNLHKTFLHETVHAAFYLSGLRSVLEDEKIEEAVCSMVENLAHVMRDVGSHIVTHSKIDVQIGAIRAEAEKNNVMLLADEMKQYEKQ